MKAWPYWKMVSRRALAATLSHAKEKILFGLVLAVIGLGLQYLLAVRNLSDSKKIAISLVGSAVIVMIASFLKNLITEPALLYVEKQRSQIDEDRLSKVRAAINKHEPNAAKVLRHLRVVGNLKSGWREATVLPEGIDWTEPRSILAILAEAGIVEVEHHDSPTTDSSPVLAMMRSYSIWRVVSVMESAVDEVLG